jgi:Kef-type K+ transport system membrane component KefB
MGVFEHMLPNLSSPLLLLIIQVVAILLLARMFGYIAGRMGQPVVMGEILAGIVLGPSLLGHLLPGVSSFLFAAPSLGNLHFLSQVGLMLFMFIIGMELDMHALRRQARNVIVISQAGIVIPYLLGMWVAYFLYDGFAPPGVSFLSFALFMGIAMSITAFPVLARILQERRLSKTRLGVMAITCAAAGDVTAWCMLAVVIAVVKQGSLMGSLLTILLACVYVVLMMAAVRPFLSRMASRFVKNGHIGKPLIMIALIVLLVSAGITELLGIHVLFGSFLAGAVMPAGNDLRKLVADKIETIVLVLLLPLFFVFTGLRTEIGLLGSWAHWCICLLLIAVAVIGKFGGTALASRVMGQSTKDGLALGVLMNTRGLVELIVLNIGYDLGILTPEIFTMMVIMALVTTFMTCPLLDVIL